MRRIPWPAASIVQLLVQQGAPDVNRRDATWTATGWTEYLRQDDVAAFLDSGRDMASD